jgi:AcrR family transcriptional regulator
MSVRGGGNGSGAGHAGRYFAAFVPGRRGEVLDAALEVFANKGYDGGTMREIAACLGVTEPALYRHYAGKEALFEDLLAVAADHVIAKAGEAMESVDPEHLRRSLHRLIEIRRGHVHSGNGVAPVMRMIFAPVPHNAVFRDVFRSHLADPMLDRLRVLVPRIDAHFGIRRTEAALESSLRAFLSLFVGYFMTGMMLELPDDDEAIVEAMMAAMGWNTPAG